MARLGTPAGWNVLGARSSLGAVVLAVSACALAADLRVSLNGQWAACGGPRNDDYTAIITGERAWQTVTVPARKWPTDELNEAPAVWVAPSHGTTR